MNATRMPGANATRGRRGIGPPDRRHATTPRRITGLALVALAFAVSSPAARAAAKAEERWVERGDCKLVEGRFADGDSFVLEWRDEKGKTTTRTYRLYGVDCPESDGKDRAVQSRIAEQTEAFGIDRATLLDFGKQAARFTGRALKRGKVRLFTRGSLGQEVPKHAGRAQRRYALLEVLDEQGKPRWLHELLLENGLARARGQPAAWPPSEEDRHGREAAEREFAKQLERLETRARQAKAGVWAEK